jgi:hypothetical protein
MNTLVAILAVIIVLGANARARAKHNLATYRDDDTSDQDIDRKGHSGIEERIDGGNDQGAG